MAREIKTSLIVDGEQAFKRSINEANTSMKNLGTQLTLAQAQFKKDGDAMKLMETRSKALKGEIDQQEKIVEALEKAVQDSAKAYGENSEKTEKWQAELNRAKAKLTNLQSELTLNEQGLDRNGKAFDESSQHAADYQATLQSIGKNVSFETITSGIHGITGVIEGAIKKVFSFAKAIRETFADAGEWADTLMTDATKYGMDVETLQAWQNAADFIDTDVSTIITARDKLGKKMKGGWKDGDIDMWQMLGIDLKDAETGKWRDKMDVMWEVGETLMNMAKIDGDDVRADQYAMEVFGKSWRDLLPLFTAGREEWEKTVASQQVVSEERVKALGELDDANQALENSWDVTKYSFLAELAPVVTDVTNAVTEMLKAFNEWMDTDEGKQAMNDISDAIRELFAGLKDVSFKDAIDAVAGAIDGIKKALIWLEEHKDDVKMALEVIAGGFALLKVSELALNIGKIVSGFQTLWAGAKNPLPSLPGTGGNNGGSPTATPTGDGTGTGTGLGGGWLASKWAAFKAGLAEVMPLIAQEAAVIGVSIAPAVIAQKNDEARWKEELESAEAAADALEETLGESSRDAEILRSAAQAVGPKRKADGSYETDATGWFLNMNPTQQAETVLQSLSDPKMRGILYSDFRRYGDMENDSVAGWNPWTMMMRYWGMPVEDAYGNKVTEPLSQGEIDELVTYIRDIYQKKVEEQTQNQDNMDTATLMSDAVAEMKVNTQSTKTASETVAGMDIKKFNGLPAELQTAAQRGTAAGVSGIRVYLDGATVGRLVAPYVNASFGAMAQ
ncbi:MAG: hypothetical protein IKE81_12490 [Clostridia bacterium]|nr:hypothetical protein [Clostridia bacterium]